MSEKMWCWTCDWCNTVAMYKGCGQPIEVQAKKRKLQFCSQVCRTTITPSKLWVDIRKDPVVLSDNDTPSDGQSKVSVYLSNGLDR